MDLMTSEEKSRLEARLAELIDHRPVISKRIAEARALGDLKENAEYHASREEQGMEEAEIKRIQDRLAQAQVVDTERSRGSGVVFIGATVRLREEHSGDEDVYRLVGEASGVLTEEYFEVTTNSPMGEALMKARLGETVTVRTPRGDRRFLVVEIL